VLTRIVQPLRLLWLRVLKPLLQLLDRGLVLFASLFGVQHGNPLTRALWLQGLFLALYLIGLLPVPHLPVAALLAGYLGVLAVGRAWVDNEKWRTRIVKKLDNANPDELPDLRGVALLSALQLLVLAPLLFWQLQRHHPWLFYVPPGHGGFLDWLEFSFDPYAKVVFDWLEGDSRLPEEVVRSHDIRSASLLGSVLRLLKRLTIDFILVQGIVRLFAINTTIKEGVAALRQDMDMTLRVGRRAVLPLIDLLHGPDAELRTRAAEVLGRLRDARAVPALLQALADPVPEVRWRAAQALGEIGDPQAVAPLLQALRDGDATVRSFVVEALARLPEGVALPALEQVLRGDEAGMVRAAAVPGIRLLAGAQALDILLPLLRDSDFEVRKAVIAAVGQTRDARALEPLGQMVLDQTLPPDQRAETARALENLGDARAVPSLIQALADGDSFVRRCAVQALGKLRDGQAGAALRGLANDPAVEVREAVALALGTIRDPQGPAALVHLLNDPREEVRDAAGQALTQLGEDVSGPALLEALAAGDSVPRPLVIELLGDLHYLPALPVLSQHLRGGQRDIRLAAASALGRLGDPAAAEALSAALHDADSDVRAQAAEALAWLKKK